MGYTHYWKSRKAFTDEQWNAFLADAQAVFDRSTVPIVNGLREPGTKPTVELGSLYFNGEGSDGCETCCIYRKSIDFDCCKTRGKPYDAVVVEVLKLARKHNPWIELSSDGENIFD